MGDMSEYFLSTEDYWERWDHGLGPAYPGNSRRSFLELDGCFSAFAKPPPHYQKKFPDLCPWCGDGVYPDKENNRLFCSNPKCKYQVYLDQDKCPYCGSGLVLKTGKHGKFYGCSRFPKCKGNRNFKEV